MAIDYKNFSQNGPIASQTNGMRRWWLASDEELPFIIQGVIDYLHTHQGARLTQNIMSMRMYGNVSIMGLNGLSYSRFIPSQNAVRDRLTLNVVQSGIDTIVAKIAKNKPKALFLTSGGDYRLQQKAKNLCKFVDGIFYENDAYHQGPYIFRDGCVFGNGVTHVFNHYGRIKHEQVLPLEIYVDEVEAQNGHPRQMHRVKNVDRMMLVDMFPSKKKKIMEVNMASYDQIGGYQNVSDVVTVRESWHLPSGPDATDGRHCITVDNATLLNEQYDKHFFPFAVFAWNKKMLGWWAQSAVEEIQNIQLEINKLLWVLQRSYNLAGSFKVLMENGSKIVKEHLTNDVGAVICYTGAPPQYVVPPVVPMEMYSHLENLVQKAYMQLGVSQLSSGSVKPQGLDSGKALREYNDIESDRFMTVGHNYEKYFMDLARLDIEMAKEISEVEGSYKTRAVTRNKTVEIDWKNVNLKDDEFVMKAYPVSELSDEPSERLQTIQEYMQAGLMSPTTGRRLLDFPDLEQVEDLQNAEEEYINEVLEKIIEAEDESTFIAVQPEPYDNLDLCKELGLQYYANGKKSGLEEWKLSLIRNWIDRTGLLMTLAQPPPMQQPQANPEPAPTSNLISNVPPIGAPQAA